MNRLYDGKTLGEFRDNEKKEALERYRTRQQLQKEQQERERMEQEAAKKSEHESMREIAVRIKEAAADIEAGNPAAFSKALFCVRQLSEVATYILDNMETRNALEAEPAPEVKE